ncbi:hypothetical protein JAAN108728_14505 [Janibacter anophelis]
MPSSIALAFADASTPPHSTGSSGWTLSGASIPMTRTDSPPLMSTLTVSPSTTRMTRYFPRAGAADFAEEDFGFAVAFAFDFTFAADDADSDPLAADPPSARAWSLSAEAANTSAAAAATSSASPCASVASGPQAASITTASAAPTTARPSRRLPRYRPDHRMPVLPSPDLSTQQ